MATSLNIPKKVDQFESVAFVHDMSHFQLKVLVKRLFENFHALANACDTRDAKISRIIDSILSGESWKEDDLSDRFKYLYHKEDVIAFDSLENTFTIMAKTNSTKKTHALTRKAMDKLLKHLKQNGMI